MIRSFIFDIGNVLIPFDFNRAIRRIAADCPLPVESLPAAVKPWIEAYEAGRMDRATFLRQTIAHLDYRGSEADFVAAWEDIFEENPPMTRLVRHLHGRYPLYLLSNTSDIHVNHFEAKYPVFAHFSGAVYSYLAGCIKPERPIFELAIRQFGVDPAATVYIDDLPANVAAARDVGFRAFQYDYRQHHCLVEYLATLGVEGLAQ